MRYVDGYVLPVPKKNLKAYLRMARLGEKVWRKHGALDYKECVGDDLEHEVGIPFSRLMKLKPGETVVFSYIVFKSRAHRDRVNAKVMKDMRTWARRRTCRSTPSAWSTAASRPWLAADEETSPWRTTRISSSAAA